MIEQKTTKLPKGLAFKNIGDTGLSQNPAYNDEDFLRKFRGTQFYRTIQEMINNEPVIASSSFCIKKLIKQAPVSIIAGSKDAKDVAAAEFCEEARLDMSQSWSNFMEECLSHVDYGFSVHEINYKVRRGQNRKKPSERSEFDDNKIGWRGFPIRAQATVDEWAYDPDGFQEISGFYQDLTNTTKRSPDRRVFIPIEKVLHFRTGVYKANPQGQSIYRRAYVPYYYKKELQRIQSIGYERSFNGLPIIYAPIDIMTDDATDEQKSVFAEMKKIVSNIRNDEQAGLVMPNEYDENGNRLYEFELKSSEGNVDEGMEVSIRRYTLEILMTTLTDLLLLGHGENGSFALASAKSSMFAIAASNYMREIEEVFNKSAIPRLLALNGISYRKAPKLDFGNIEITDIDVISTMVKDLSVAGMDLSDVEDDLRRRMLIPVKTESEPMFTAREAKKQKEEPNVPDNN